MQIPLQDGYEIEHKIQEMELSQKYIGKNKTCQKVYETAKFKCSR